MIKKIIIAAALVACLAPAFEAQAIDPHTSWPHVGARADRNAMAMAASRPWHANYYHTMTGYPIPLVVPPTAHMETRYSWGVAQTTMTPIYHQYQRPYTLGGSGGVVGGAGVFRPTPMWPSHTDQFGVYYVRGPW